MLFEIVSYYSDFYYLENTLKYVFKEQNVKPTREIFWLISVNHGVLKLAVLLSVTFRKKKLRS